MSTENLFICDVCKTILYEVFKENDDDDYCSDCFFKHTTIGKAIELIRYLTNENLALKKDLIFDKLLRNAGLYTDLIGLVFEYLPPTEQLEPYLVAELCEKCNVYCYPNPYGMSVCAHEICNCEHPIIDESSDEESSDEEINEEVQFFGSDEEE